MKLVLPLISLFVFACSGTKQVASVSNSKTDEKVDLVTTDIDNFWKAYELCKGSSTATQEKIIDSIYIKNASRCLKEILEVNKLTAQGFLKYFNNEKDYFEKCKVVTEKIKNYEAEIKNYLFNLKAMYPAAKFCDIYFMFTQFYTGGQSKNAGIAIGMDFWSLPDSTPVIFNNPLFTELVRKIDVMPVTVIHELVHRNQNIKSTGSLLDKCLIEGSADFIAYLVTQKLNNTKMHDFANKKEEVLWHRFKKDMISNNTAYWLYNSYDSSRPRDLGYWMGFKICENYYNNSTDKSTAIHNLMNISDSKAFLISSGYHLKLINN